MRKHPAPTIREVSATAIVDGVSTEITENVVADGEFLIKIDGRTAARLTCLPDQLDLLGWGFLAGGGWIGSRDDVMSFRRKGNIVSVELKNKLDSEMASVLSSCGKEVVFKPAHPGKTGITPPGEAVKTLFSSGNIKAIMNRFQKNDSLHARTGATHSAGLGCGGELLFSIPDVGRHNAVQKVLGKIFIEGIETSDKMLFTTGRVSSEMVSSCAELFIPVVVSKSAPMASSLDRAREMGVTVIGFVRGSRMTCFTFPERIRP